ncbi:hypothetical protein KP001_08590 [Geomonas subterranea]|uniref:MarR family transcriptional regulator n=1 Tax=Geomonas subterranea TaxID=2847989 RepID=A0ABX8LQN8_9BACT|nr:hypothetical protein [Geomonas subterranea]QXE92558.1 hypothetical protein KP001_08590 [Geomonas subterranea]QXM09344.1 hypothetical protein KP002_20685 [Geomonas subterranea]
MSKTGLQRFRNAMNVLNEVYAEIPIQQILIFLEVAECGEISMTELRKRLNMSPSSLTRNTLALSYYSADHPENPCVGGGRMIGHNLIERRSDINNRRTLMVFLTPKGIEVRNKIEAALSI